jgi:hypothetical protein
LSVRRGRCRILDRRGRKFLSIKKFGSGSGLCGQASAPIDLATPSDRHRYIDLGWGAEGGRKEEGGRGAVDGTGVAGQSSQHRGAVGYGRATSNEQRARPLLCCTVVLRSSGLLPTCLTCWRAASILHGLAGQGRPPDESQ